MSTESYPTPNREIIFNLQSSLETDLAEAFGIFKSIASNLLAISSVISLIDLSIHVISISLLVLILERASFPKQGIPLLFKRSPEIPTLIFI